MLFCVILNQETIKGFRKGFCRMNQISDKFEILKNYFGHTQFRNGQEEVIDNLYSKRDCVCIMPTGAGKSMCYQIPAMMMSGITIVVSPLISLMQDQVNSLIQSGVSAAYVNSSLNLSQYGKVLRLMSESRYKIVYVAPERLESESFVDICQKIDISMVAVDEAHCVSHWGQDFRPSYLNISEFISKIGSRPVVGAFTATATKQVKDDIVKLLKLNDPFQVTTGFDRPNLYFSVLHPESKSLTLMSLIRQRQSLCGIVYCSTRNNVEKICDIINENGMTATRYHAGLSEEERKKNQDDFVFDRVSVMVATNAFGMGIDKSNVSYVIHYNMPKNLESYYQEAGRAGRDGSHAECILMYAPNDVRTAKFFIENNENSKLSEEEKNAVKERELERLKYMTIYCTTKDCLRSFMLRYFGERTPNYCGKCSNCVSNFETADITIDAQKILSCVVRMRENFGIKMVCDVLRGSRNARVLGMHFDSLSTYGLMKDYSENKVRSIINSLIVKNCLNITEGKYPLLKLGKNAMPVLKGEVRIQTQILKDEQIKPPKQGDNSNESAFDAELLEHLKSLRKNMAARASVPAYVIFTDAALKDMCRKKPKSLGEFSNVSGVGRVKVDKYGEIFIKAITDFEKSHTSD